MKPVKALILGILLLVPILVFIFISVFGTHHFSLKTYYPKLDDKGNVVYDAAGDTIFQRVPYFALASQQNKIVTQADLDSSFYVVNFFSTDCPDTCQDVFSELLRVQEAYANNPRIKFVSISVNPAADSVEALQKFADQYGINNDKWFLLTGEHEDIYSLANEGFHQPIQLEGNAPVVFNEELILVDMEKKIRGIYQGADTKDVDRLILEINVLLDEYSKRK